MIDLMNLLLFALLFGLSYVNLYQVGDWHVLNFKVRSAEACVLHCSFPLPTSLFSPPLPSLLQLRKWFPVIAPATFAVMSLVRDESMQT